MARLNKYGCPQPPQTQQEETLQNLLEQRALLVQQMTSPVLEIEQPSMGRTQFRSIEEMQEQLRVLDGLIAGMTPSAADPNAWRKARRPLYPVPL